MSAEQYVLLGVAIIAGLVAGGGLTCIMLLLVDWLTRP